MNDVPLGASIARALENIFQEKLPTDTWEDVADRLVIRLSGTVSFVPKRKYDHMVRMLRTLGTGSAE